MSRRIARALAITVLALTVSAISVGCAQQAVKAPPQAAATPPAAVSHPQPAPAAPPEALPPPAPKLEASDFKDAYFDFNKFELRDDTRAALDADAKLLREHPGTRITLEGHCDERGTIEYNVALGEKRADAAKQYLTQSGVDISLIKTMSYGKDRPFCTEHNEACWAKNRCVHFAPGPGPA